MKTSVLIIAHNEEKYIEECIRSILNQTHKANEIVLLLHNSIDKTLEIAQKYSIKIVSFNGSAGPVYARIEGLKHVSGEIILCIDGDSCAESNWIKTMVTVLEKNNNILVGSLIKFKGSFFSEVSNIYNKYFCVSCGRRATRWLWGASFAFWGKDKEKVQEYFQNNLKMIDKLNLDISRSAEDYYLACIMNQIGRIEVTNKTFVTAHEKEGSSLKSFSRNIKNINNARKIKAYVGFSRGK